MPVAVFVTDGPLLLMNDELAILIPGDFPPDLYSLPLCWHNARCTSVSFATNSPSVLMRNNVLILSMWPASLF